MPIPAIIAGVAGLLGAGIGAGVANKQMSEKRRLQEKQRQEALADRAHDESYNSPSAQKNRLLQAGLSPTQFGSVSATDSSGDVPEYSPSDEGYSGLINATEMGVNSVSQSIQLQMAQERNQAEIDNLFSEIAKRGEDKRSVELLNTKLNATLENDIEQSYLNNMLTSSKIRETVASTSKLLQEGRLTGVKRRAALLSLMYSEDTYDAMVRMAKAKADNAELDKAVSQYKLDFVLPQELQESIARVNKMSQEISSMRQSDSREWFRLESDITEANQRISSSKQSNQRDWIRLDADVRKLNSEIVNIDYNNSILEFRSKHVQEQYDNEVRRIAAEIEKTGADAALAQKQANWYCFNQVMNQVWTATEMGIKGFSAYATGGMSEIAGGLSGMFTTTPSVTTTPFTYGN